MDDLITEEIKDQLMEWYLKFGERGVLGEDAYNAGFTKTPMYKYHAYNNNEFQELITDTTPLNMIDETLWALSPLALEIIKGNK